MADDLLGGRLRCLRAPRGEKDFLSDEQVERYLSLLHSTDLQALTLPGFAARAKRAFVAGASPEQHLEGAVLGQAVVAALDEGTPALRRALVGEFAAPAALRHASTAFGVRCARRGSGASRSRGISIRDFPDFVRYCVAYRIHCYFETSRLLPPEQGEGEELEAAVPEQVRHEVVFALGGPGAGKTTQCARIAAVFGHCHLRVRALLEARRGASVVAADIDAAPAEQVVDLLRAAIQDGGSSSRSFIVEAFPRSSADLEAWQRSLGSQVKTTCGLFFAAPESVLSSRLQQRGADVAAAAAWSGKLRGEVGAVLERLSAAGLLRKVAAEGGVEEVWRSVQGILGPTVVFTVGSPGAGKGTQCERIARTFGYTHLSTGALLREECHRDPAIQKIIAEGKLVSPETVVALLRRKMEEQGWAGRRYVVDGFPRSMANLDHWNASIKGRALVKFCLHLDCSEAIGEARRLEFGKTSGHADDNPETIRKRFQTWYHESQPVLQRFKEEGLLHRVDADQTVEAVWRGVQELFGPSVIFAVGGPGAGKGTQCSRISDAFGYQHLSTGDLVRAELQRPASSAKALIEEHVREGRLVPDELVLGLVQRAMEERGWEGGKYIIDGFPRSVANWIAWHKIFGHKASVKQALFFDCSEAIMEARLHGLEHKRCNDDQETIRKRLEVFRAEAMPVINQLDAEGLLRRIDASKTKDDVWADVKKLFGPSVIFVLGASGVDKRTQCARLAETFGYHHLRMEDLLEEERRRPSSRLSEQRQATAELQLDLLQRAMEEIGWEGGRYAVDGFPRSCADLEAWDGRLAPRVSTKLALLLQSGEAAAPAPAAALAVKQGGVSAKAKGRRLLMASLRSGEAGRILDKATDADLEGAAASSTRRRSSSGSGESPESDAESLALARSFTAKGLLRKVRADQEVEAVWKCVQEALHFDLDSQLQNYAVVLVKHKASNEDTDRFVQSFLAMHDIAVTASGTIPTAKVLSSGLFDKAFQPILNYATGKPEAIRISKARQERFKAITGEEWAQAVAEGHVLSAASALSTLGHTADSLGQVWDGGSVKLHRVDQYLDIAWIPGENGSGAWVINGYALQWRNAFIESAKSGGDTRVRWFSVEFSTAQVSWERFNNELLGATDPKGAAPDSIRGQFYRHWRTLGLQSPPDIFDNCVIASAGPLEGLREWMLWTGGALRDHPLARSLMSGGVPESTLEAWLENPLVEGWRVGQDSFDGPLFACSEDVDHAAFRASALHHVVASGGSLCPWPLSMKSMQKGDVTRRCSKSGVGKASALTLLHFNDVYNVEARKKEPVGGIARFVTRMRELKAEAAARGEEAMCIFSGDAFNPSLTSTVTKGKHMVPALNAVGIDVACYGNHDFDFGVDELTEMASESNFPWLISNVVEKATGEGLANGRVTLVLDWSGRKIGVMGLVEREWMVTLHTIEPEDVVYEDFCQCGRRLGRQLREEGADLVIAITHMRVPNDELLAQEVEEIDLIMGGHDHHYDVKPVGPFGTYVLKSGTDFRDITALRLRFTDGPGPKAFEVLESRHVEIDSSIREDPEMRELAEKCAKQVGDSMNEVLGHSAVDLDCRFCAIRTRETNVGNFIADVMRQGLKADMAMVNSGTLRADAIIEKGPIHVRDLLSILPMLDELCLLELSGAQVLSVLQNGVSQYPRLEGRFLQVSGVTFTFDAAKRPGERLDESTVRIGGELVEASQRYRVCTLNYLRQGKDGFDALKGAMCLADGEQAGMLPTLVREHLTNISTLNGTTPTAPAYRVKRATTMIDRSQLSRYGMGPRPLQQLAISPEVKGRIVCLNPSPEG